MFGASDVEIEKILNKDLNRIAVVNQGLDNQWVSRNLLDSMLEHGKSLQDTDIADQRQRAMRNEWLRSLLNTPQIIVNRAFFPNNPAIYCDYLQAGEPRNAFKDLLGESTIVPFLFKESDLTEEHDFTTKREGQQAWKKVVSECGSVKCLRLSWDEDENSNLIRHRLAKKFHALLLLFPLFEEVQLERDFGLDAAGARRMKQRMKDVQRWASDNDPISRDEFYKEFVVADGTEPAEGKYDTKKPFAGELKQLVDLQYNVALADALTRYPFSPVDSLDRTALQELHIAPQTALVTPDQLAALLQQQAFALALRPLNVGLTGLELHHVRQARATDEWEQYIQSLHRLLNTPQEFPALGQDVYNHYVDLASQLSQIVGTRRAGVVDSWQPTIKLIVETLGAVITIAFGDQLGIEVAGEVATAIAAEGSTAVVRFAVVGQDQRRASAQLETSFELMRVQFERTGQEWNDLINQLQSAGFPLREATHPPENDATMDAPRKRAM